MLLGRLPGVRPPRVVVLGGGTAGTSAARAAVGLGAEVTILDTSVERLRELDLLFGSSVQTLHAMEGVLESLLPETALRLVLGLA